MILDGYIGQQYFSMIILNFVIKYTILTEVVALNFDSFRPREANPASDDLSSFRV